jgi:hypothetical protein
MFGNGNDTARRGLAAHLAVAQRLVELGYEVLEPFGDYLRYDLAYFYPGMKGGLVSSSEQSQLVRIQCKVGRLSADGSYIVFNAFNVTHGGKGKKRGYHGEAEYFGVYCEELRKVYLIAVDEVGRTDVRLRLKSAGVKRGNRFSSKHVSWEEANGPNIRWAEDCEI